MINLIFMGIGILAIIIALILRIRFLKLESSCAKEYLETERFYSKKLEQILYKHLEKQNDK